jgi:hypothetical protein
MVVVAHVGGERQSVAAAVDLLEATLGYGRARQYTGYDYADGMSSKLLDWLPIDNKWVNLVVQESIKRAPINLRPLFMVPKRQSYKGTALFALANQQAHDLTGDERYATEHHRLLEWLIDHRIEGYAGFCGGHRHALQDLHGRVEADTPDLVSTAYAMRALLEAGRSETRYADVARNGADFFVEDLEYSSAPVGARLNYRPTDSGEWYVLNANAIAGRTFIDLYDVFGAEEYRRRATELFEYVVANQTDAGGWMYTDPPSASHLSMDNHHNGFIVESLLRYRSVTGSDRFEPALVDGLAFYRDTLFESNGAPNWDEDSRYPKDIHAAAQGIITFSRSGDLALARRIMEWTCANLHDGEGQFFYQKRRYYTKRMTLMRWCQAWMAFAIGTYCRRSRSTSDVSEAVAGSRPDTMTDHTE